MSHPGQWWRRLGMLLNRSRVDRDLAEEMQSHLTMREARLREQGQDGEAARRAARRRFGNPVSLREEAIDAWGWRWIEHLAQDLRFAWRTLVKKPGFSVAVTVTLALAIGATTSIFSVVNGVLLRPLPFDAPERLVAVYGRAWRSDRGSTPDPLTGPVVFEELDAYARESTSFEGFAGYEVRTRHADAGSGIERWNAVAADLSLFDVLGIEPVAGRVFRPGDQADALVISEGLWERRFDRSPTILGSRVMLDGQPFSIVGVMPAQFQFPYSAASLLPGTSPEARTDIWLPFPPPDGGARTSERRGRVRVVARMRPGVSRSAAESELRVIAARLEDRHRGADIRVGVRLERLSDTVLHSVRSSLWLLFGAAGLVLLTACANVANLLLARMTVRTREVVTRAALGAGRLRLVRQFFAESLLLALAGGLAGAGLARWGTDLLVSLYTGRIPRAHEVALDWRVFAFLLLCSLVTAVLFGLAPAFTAARIDVRAVTREATGHQTAGRRLGRLRDALATIEIALAFALAVGALLLVREVGRLQDVDAGMDPRNVVVLHLTPRVPAADYYAMEARTAALPGARAAGFIQLLPLQNWGWNAGFNIRGRAPAGTPPAAELRYVTPGYFAALGIPIVAGRGFSDADREGAPRVILVNQALANRYFPGEHAVGRELDRGTIVGIAGDVRDVHLSRAAEPTIYYPAAQNVTMTSDLGMSLVVRAAGNPESLVPAIRRAVTEVNPNLAIFNVMTMEQVIEDSLWQLRLYRWLIGLFAALALVLAAIGIYGVVSYAAAARTREFAVRLALGSSNRALAALVMRRALLLTSGGLACGLATVLMLTWIVGDTAAVRPDPSTCAIVAAVVCAITVLACALPTARTAALDPAAALRQD